MLFSCIKIFHINHSSKSPSIVFFLVVAILTLRGFSFSNELAFGTQIEPIAHKDIQNNQITIPDKNNVSVLFFFNIGNDSHLRIVSKLNLFFLNLIERKKNILPIFVSKGKAAEFDKAKNDFNLKFHIINDLDNKLMSFFDYRCGQCNKVAIIDKDGILRYNASYVDLYYIERIAERYEPHKEGVDR